MKKKKRVLKYKFPRAVPQAAGRGLFEHGNLYFKVLLCLFFGFSTAHAEHLKLISDNGTRDLTRMQVRKRSKAYMVRIKDPIDGKGRSYHSIKVEKLFEKEEWKKAKSVQFIAADGMTVTIKKEKLDTPMPNESKAWLAYQPVNRKSGWPKTRSGKSIGPNYLIWEHPEKSDIKPEEWPFQITAVKLVNETVWEMYPKIRPNAKLSPSSIERKGYEIFVKNCFPCHTINKEGPGKFGPDLNVPSNPTEYWREDWLVKYIRSPRGVRHWPQSKMPSFDKKEIADKELGHLIQYLKHMASQRPQG